MPLLGEYKRELPLLKITKHHRNCYSGLLRSLGEQKKYFLVKTDSILKQVKEGIFHLLLQPTSASN